MYSGHMTFIRYIANISLILRLVSNFLNDYFSSRTLKFGEA